MEQLAHPTRRIQRTGFFAVPAVAIAALCALTSCGGSGQSTSPSSTSEAIDTNKIILTQSAPASQAASYGSLQVFDACSLLPESVITGTGLAMAPNPIKYGAPNGNVPADKAFGRESAQPVSECVYPVKQGDDFANFGVEVRQPPFNSQDDIDFSSHVPASVQAHSVSGITWYHKPDDSRKSLYDVYLFNPAKLNLLVNFYISLPGTASSLQGGSIDDVAAKMADAIAANIAKGPQGPVSFSYGAPAQAVPSACSLATADIVESVFKLPDWHWSEDSYQQAVSQWAYGWNLPTGCQRYARQGQELSPRSLYFDFFNSQGEEGAKQFLQQRCAMGQHITLSTKIGDESCVLLDKQGSGVPVLYFRVGRVVGSVYISGTEQATLQDMGNYLAPAAQMLVPKMHY